MEWALDGACFATKQWCENAMKFVATTVSTKGQAVLPGPLRRRLGIRAASCFGRRTRFPEDDE
jgi:hypothetical protein